MTEQQTWQTIVKGYLLACFEDHQLARKSKLSNQQSGYLQQFGSELIASMHRQYASECLKGLEPPPVENAWKVIEESDAQVLVEIPVGDNPRPSSHRVPFITTRILLMKPRGQWQIQDILRPCIGCNRTRSKRTREAGKCQICNRTGSLAPVQDEPYSFCDGTGECPRCRAESIPGWQRASFLGR